jgi:hypothetical protein
MTSSNFDTEVSVIQWTFLSTEIFISRISHFSQFTSGNHALHIN